MIYVAIAVLCTLSGVALGAILVIAILGRGIRARVSPQEQAALWAILQRPRRSSSGVTPSPSQRQQESPTPT